MEEGAKLQQQNSEGTTLGWRGETHLAGDFREKQRSLTIFQEFLNIFIILLHPKVRLEFL